MEGEKGSGEEKLSRRSPPCHLRVWLQAFFLLSFLSLLHGPEEIGWLRRLSARRRRPGRKDERILSFGLVWKSGLSGGDAGWGWGGGGGETMKSRWNQPLT